VSPGERKPAVIVNSAAPIRICDNGGWTDTWFAGHGRIFNIGVYPIVEVQVEVYPRSEATGRLVINAENFGERYTPESSGDGEWDRHPLLEAAIARMAVPDDLALEVTIFSEAPSGAGTGTSAAVTVALVGALDCLTPGRMMPREVAYMAHAVETGMLGLQSGIQDQLCSAFGGVNFIEMHEYPHAEVSRIQVPDPVWWELERRLALIYLGRSHHSSVVHEQVIRGLENEGPDSPRLAGLRVTAEASRDSLYRGDFDSLGRAMAENTAAQRELHPDLVSRDADRVIGIAREYGAVGWKVNGAGGEGGSVTLLCSEQSAEKRAMVAAIESEGKKFANIPIYLSRFGLRQWRREGESWR
jgi:D-glycero-alpha-D-manno-heptose-7-phosphate kinase